MGNSKDTGKLIAALLAGAVIGGVLGVLFAPDKGTETRKKLMSEAKDLVDNLKKKVNPGEEDFHNKEEEMV